MAHNQNIIIKRGDYGPHVIQIQKGLRKAGFWPAYVPYSKNFGPTTDKYLRLFQEAKGLVKDGKAGNSTITTLGVDIEMPTSGFDEKYKDVIIKGSTFPDKPVSYNARIRLNSEIVNEYIPTMLDVMKDEPRGFQLLVTIMAYKEGFRKSPRMTRSYRTHNPGNIGNTDNGMDHPIGNLRDGIRAQQNYIRKVVEGRHGAYPMNGRKIIPAYLSEEVAKHSKMYGMSPYLPGYDFIFTGELEQFVKIYATGARAGNGYLSMIISYFKKNGYVINEHSKIQDIIKMR